MNRELLLLGLPLLLLCVVPIVPILHELRRAERLAARIRSIRPREGGPGGSPAAPGGRLPLRLIGRLGSAITESGLLSQRTLAALEQTLTAAGFRRGHGLGLFVGSKLLLAILLPLGAILLLRAVAISPLLHNMLVAGAALFGLLAPDFAIRRLRARYLASLTRGLPDALDLMVICSEAGLGLEPAIVRVAGEIGEAHQAVAEELAQIAVELRINADARVALLNAGTRTGLESMKRLGTTLVQTIQYGTPVSQALRVLAAEMRQEMLTRFEARAARLPVLLTMPMVCFILPCVFLIVGGPAILRVMKMMSGP